MLPSKGHSVVSEWKFCHHCNEAAKKMEESSTKESEIDDEDVDYGNELKKKEKHKKLNESLSMFDISHLKSNGLQSRTQISMALEKWERSYEKQKETAADILEISSPEFGSPTGSKLSKRELFTKAADLDYLLYAMKAKLEDGNMKTGGKIKKMTLAPESWSLKKVLGYFNVSEYIVHEACTLKENKGILLLPDKKKGGGLSQKVLDFVQLFYKDNKFSGMMPGEKILWALATKSTYRNVCYWVIKKNSM